MCRWVFDPRYPGLPRYMAAKARNGDHVFINGDFVHEFVKCIPKLQLKKHVFVVHNSIYVLFCICEHRVPLRGYVSSVVHGQDATRTGRGRGASDDR